jgi:hypothetical protein
MKRYLDLRNLVLAGITMVALAGCDALAGPELTLSADKTTISAGGHDYAELTATVLKKKTPASGQPVYFETEFGSFSATEEITSLSVATDADGLAVVRLYSPVDQGQTEVVATFEDEESGLDAVDRITITFGPPQAGNLPVHGRFQLECSHLNVGALRNPKPDIQVPCNLTAQTVRGDVLSVESLNVFYLAEAGTLATVYEEDDYNVIYSVQGGNSGPVDVEPAGGEPSRTGSLGETYNPRDGVVTLLAITAGTESWTDINDNGERDGSEPFEDIGEPFLDVNDNGTYDVGEDYWDTNQDGEHTGPNGQFDDDTMIAAQAKIIWTGELREAADAARIETDPVSTVLGNGDQMTLEVWLLDKHMNPIAAFLDAGDYMELTDTSYNLVFTPDYSVSLNERLGMRFDDSTGGIMEFYYNDGCTQNAGCYQVTAMDGSTSLEAPPLNFTISFTLYTTPGPQEFYWLNQEQSWFVQTITGTTE